MKFQWERSIDSMLMVYLNIDTQDQNFFGKRSQQNFNNWRLIVYIREQIQKGSLKMWHCLSVKLSSHHRDDIHRLGKQKCKASDSLSKVQCQGISTNCPYSVPMSSSFRKRLFSTFLVMISVKRYMIFYINNTLF